MPRYDYKCDGCEEVEEIEHSMAETLDYHACRNCETGFLHKVFTPVPGHFKGQGWGKVYRNHAPKENS